MKNEIIIATTETQNDYELLDSGDGEKLERFGAFVIRRPDPQVLWNKAKPELQWQHAHAEFVRTGTSGSWKKNVEIPETWNINFGNATFQIKLSPFKHTGLFPEQLSNWKWIGEKLKTENLKLKTGQGAKKVKILNLFGYTGGATLAAAFAGAEVVHVDASKGTIGWAKENVRLSGLDEKPIRWIEDDAYKFVDREIRRGNTYDGIIMDPPAFGRGAKGEVWKIEKKFLPLLELSEKLLSKDALFFLVNGYASGYSVLAYKNALEHIMKRRRGTIEAGELAIKEGETERLLPAGIFARWSV